MSPNLVKLAIETSNLNTRGYNGLSEEAKRHATMSDETNETSRKIKENEANWRATISDETKEAENKRRESIMLPCQTRQKRSRKQGLDSSCQRCATISDETKEAEKRKRDDMLAWKTFSGRLMALQRERPSLLTDNPT